MILLCLADELCLSEEESTKDGEGNVVIGT